MLGNKATNNEVESTLGEATTQLQRFGWICLSSAVAVSIMKRNGFFHRTSNTKNDKNGDGMFH